MIFANCEKGIDYMLKDVSQIKISGGCEMFAEGCITFIPLSCGTPLIIEVSYHISNECYNIGCPGSPGSPSQSELK
jgi:hypothetical protein